MVNAQFFLFLVPVMVLWVATADRLDINKHRPQDASVLTEAMPFPTFSKAFAKGRRYVCVKKYNMDKMDHSANYCLADASEAYEVSKVLPGVKGGPEGIWDPPDNYVLTVADYRKCISGWKSTYMRFCVWKGSYRRLHDNARRISYSTRERVPNSCFSKVFVKGSTINGLQGAVDVDTCEKMKKAPGKSQGVFTERFSDAQMAHDAEEAGGADAEPEQIIDDYHFKDIDPSKVKELVVG